MAHEGGASDAAFDSSAREGGGASRRKEGREAGARVDADATARGRAIRPIIEERFFTGSPVWPVDQPISACYKLDSEKMAATDLAALESFAIRAGLLIQTNWIRYLRIKLFWIGKCVAGEGVEITVSDTQPNAVSFDPLTLTLNIGASDAEILHHAGKMLGFGNEYGLEKPPGRCVRCSEDADCTFGNDLTCLESGYCGWASDHESIMAAPGCGGVEPGRHLTSWDIASAQRIYGRKPPGALVEPRGRCVYIPEVTERLQALTVNPCDGVPNDTWFANIDTVTGTVTQSARLGDLELCLMASENDAGPGPTPAVSASCNRADPAQDWRFDGIELRGFGGLCVVPANQAVDAILVTAECDASNRALWSLEHARLRLTGSDPPLCAEVRDVPEGPGSPLVLKGCKTEPMPQQTFSIPIDHQRAGAIFWRSYCLSFSRSTPEPDSRVVLDTCDDAREDQRFFISGQIAAPRVSRCLESSPLNATTDSFWVNTDRCSSAAEQQWDFYW